jgi:iron complex outermembrane receptor protein
MNNSTRKPFSKRRLASLIASQSVNAALIATTATVSQLVLAEQQLMEEVVTIGTRVAGRTATDAAVPIDVIQTEELTKSGFTELGQSLQSMAPSFNFSRTQVSDGSDLFRPATLRGLQPDQTLVLVNGKRRHSQSIFSLSGTVGEGAAGIDMNAIPLTALQNVEVLRDGAAAQYGSDAIAGVINLNLKNSVDETTGFVQWGETAEGDGDALTFGINSGIEIGSNGGFLNASLEYRDTDQTNRADDSRWHQGDAESEYTSLFYNFMLPLGSGAGELYSFGGYSNRTALGSGFYREPDNAERNVPQIYADGFLPHIDNEAEDLSFAVGYRRELHDEWNLDVSAIYGENSYDFDSKNTLNSSIAAEYLVNNPGASNADIAANAGPTSGYSGGFEFDQLTVNIDIDGAIDIGAGDPVYVAFGAEYREENYQITEGELASYSCGLTDSGVFPSVIDGSTPTACGFQAYPGLRPEAAIDADRHSYAVYLDLEKDISENWLLGTAVRYEDYGDAGNEVTGKLSSRFDFTDSFSLRGAVATGFRAPSLQQSGYTAFTSNIDETGNLAQSFTAASGSALPSALGVDTLQLETSESVSLGFIWRPLDSVTVTLDGYHIEIQDRITLGGFLTAADLAGNPAAAAALAATGVQQANFFSNAVDTTTEGIDLIVSYDGELAGGDLNITFAGNLNETTVDSINAPQGISEAVAFSPISQSFLEGGQPQERATMTFNWAKNRLATLVRVNYFGETEVDYFAQNHIFIPGTRPTSVVDAAVLVDLDLSYELNDNVTLSIGGNNVFDQTPDELDSNDVLEIISGSAFKYPLRAVPYGFNGASYYLKANYRF